MKKSKVIIPAMALLLFSTAASITGTVAWFTSTRTFTMTAGKFTVAQVDGNLDVTLVSGVGTTKTSDTAISLDENARLVDSSVDLTGNAWRLDRDGAHKYADKEDASVPHWQLFERNSKTYYVAVSWTMTFTYTFATETANVGIYLDLKASNYTDAASGETPSGSAGDSAKGFRLLFLNESNSGLSTVFGNHVPELASAVTEWAASTEYTAEQEIQYNGETYSRKEAGTSGATFDSSKWTKTCKSSLALTGQDEKTNLKYVSGADATTACTATNYVYHSESYVVKNDGAGNTGAAERIATLTSGHTSEDITCIAWFEGTDPNVANSTAMKYVNASLKFYARSDA